jgi:hypothetical protein
MVRLCVTKPVAPTIAGVELRLGLVTLVDERKALATMRCKKIVGASYRAVEVLTLSLPFHVRVPSDLDEIHAGGLNDSVQTFERDERLWPRACMDCSVNVVCEKTEGVLILVVWLVIAKRPVFILNAMNPHLFDVATKPLAHQLPNFVISLPIVTQEHKPELRVNAEILLEISKFTVSQGLETAIEHEVRPAYQVTGKHRRLTEEAVFTLFGKFSEDALLHETATDVGASAEQHQMADFTAALQLPEKLPYAWVSCVPRISAVDAGRPLVARAFNCVVNVGNDLHPGMLSASLVLGSEIVNKVQVRRHTSS